MRSGSAFQHCMAFIPSTSGMRSYAGFQIWCNIRWPLALKDFTFSNIFIILVVQCLYHLLILQNKFDH